jgi:hypothetical protein
VGQAAGCRTGVEVEVKTTRLTGLLHELDDLLVELGSPFLSYALPGIDDDVIDKVLAPSERLAPEGLVVPTELREWWRWHNGTRIDTATTDRHTFGPGRWGMGQASVALMEMKLRLSGDLPGEGWQPGWVPFAWKTFIDGKSRYEWRPDRDASLVGRLDESTADELSVGLWSSDPFPPGPVAGSLAEVVDTVLDVLRDGRVVWDPDGGGRWVQVAPLDELPPYVWM